MSEYDEHRKKVKFIEVVQTVPDKWINYQLSNCKEDWEIEVLEEEKKVRIAAGQWNVPGENFRFKEAL